MCQVVNSPQKSYLCSLRLRWYSFSHCPRHMTTGDHRNKDWFENWHLWGFWKSVRPLVWLDSFILLLQSSWVSDKAMQKLEVYFNEIGKPQVFTTKDTALSFTVCNGDRNDGGKQESQCVRLELEGSGCPQKDLIEILSDFFFGKQNWLSKNWSRS